MNIYRAIRIAKEYIKKHMGYLLPVVLVNEYLCDCFRYIKCSGMVFGGRKENLIGKIIPGYHVIEKGLTMPDMRLGFGVPRVEDLIDNCLLYVKNFGRDDCQVRAAISAIKEYEQVHVSSGYELPESLKRKLLEINRNFNDIDPDSQLNATPESYFKYVNSDFRSFSNSRSSVRNYADESIPVDLMTDVIELARNTPSSCNRQGTRIHLYTDKEQIRKILAIQTGNRGFGHLVDKLIIVTGNLAYNHSVYERNQVYVDGGMMVMNLLYSLHFHKILACTLNAYLPYQVERRMKKNCGMAKSEVMVAMISCGIAPESYKIAKSSRYGLDTVLTIH